MALQLSRDQKALLGEVLESQGWDIIMRILTEDATNAQLKANQHLRDGQFTEAAQYLARFDILCKLPEQLRKAANESK